MMRRHIISLLTASLVVTCGLLSCAGGNKSGNKTLVSNSQFTVTGDSVVEGAVVVTAPSALFIESNLQPSMVDSVLQADSTTASFHVVQGKPWQSQGVNQSMPMHRSDQRLINALYNMSIDQLLANEGTAFGNEGVLTTCLSIYLSGAMLEPKHSMVALTRMVDEHGMVRLQGDETTVGCERVAWVMAAWEVYCVTGDSLWLQYVHDVAHRTLTHDRKLLVDEATGLMCGTHHELPHYYPAWMGSPDRFATLSLGSNVMMARAVDVLDEMNERLGIESDVPDLAAQRLHDAINQHLWDEARGHLTAYLYGSVYREQSPLTDNLAQAAAVLWDIADDDRAERIIDRTPITDEGINTLFPSSTVLEPYFADPSWSGVQAMWNLAAAHVRNENMLARGLAALYRAQALYGSRQMRLAGQPFRPLVQATSNLAMVYRVLLGMRFSPTGIEFAPVVPACLGGERKITGLHYRDAVLDIIVTGHGNDVTSLTIDGEEAENNFVAATLTGHHLIEITLGHKGDGSQHVTVSHKSVGLPSTPMAYWSADSCHIRNFDRRLAYRLVINGERSYGIGSAQFALPPTPTTAVLSVVASNRYGYGFTSRPWLLSRQPSIAVEAVPDSTVARMMLTARVPQGGTYLLAIDSRAMEGDRRRQVIANTHLQGTIILPTAADSTNHANVLAVGLLGGMNRILLKPVGNSVDSVLPTQSTIHLYKK